MKGLILVGALLTSSFAFANAQSIHSNDYSCAELRGLVSSKGALLINGRAYGASNQLCASLVDSSNGFYEVEYSYGYEFSQGDLCKVGITCFVGQRRSQD